jgi:hypothetical protein
MATIAFTVDGEPVSYEVADNVVRFFEHWGRNPSLGTGSPPLETAEEFAALARSAGFASTGEDFQRYFIVAEARYRQSLELTDEELDLVSGGQHNPQCNFAYPCCAGLSPGTLTSCSGIQCICPTTG